jgi:hypothetical protein
MYVISKNNTVPQETSLLSERAGQLLQQMISLSPRPDGGGQYSRLKAELSALVNSAAYAGQTLLSGSALGRTMMGSFSSAFLSLSVVTASAALLLGATGSVAGPPTAGLLAMTSASFTIAQNRALIGAYESPFTFNGQE